MKTVVFSVLLLLQQPSNVSLFKANNYHKLYTGTKSTAVGDVNNGGQLDVLIGSSESENLLVVMKTFLQAL